MKFNLLLAISAVTLALGTTAYAAQVAGLVEDGSIAILNTEDMTVKSMKVSGTSGALVGIDVRPTDGMLYGLAADGTLYTIAVDGAATMKSKLETMLPAGSMATVDFNPVADKLRVMGSDGTNLRVNVDDGKVTTDGRLKYAETDANTGKMPKIVAGAYTNSIKGTKETALFDIDATIGTLVKQTPPNDGVLTTIGMLGANTESAAFDIWSDGTKNEAWLMAEGQLWSVDLATGKATAIGKVEGVSGMIKDIAILPAM